MPTSAIYFVMHVPSPEVLIISKPATMAAGGKWRCCRHNVEGMKKSEAAIIEANISMARSRVMAVHRRLDAVKS